jgi:hypothetical protein
MIFVAVRMSCGNRASKISQAYVVVLQTEDEKYELRIKKRRVKNG